MKPSSAAKPLSRAAARNWALINQLATPGLGSLLAGRRLAGVGQLLLAVAGFVLVVGWFVVTATNFYNQLASDAEPKPAGWLGGAGALIFAAAWLWSLLTSIQILRSARDASPEKLPPPLG